MLRYGEYENIQILSQERVEEGVRIVYDHPMGWRRTDLFIIENGKVVDMIAEEEVIP
jgi:hypothetical protein